MFCWFNSPSAIHYVSIIQNGKVIRDNWSTTDPEVVIGRDAIWSNPKITLSNVLPTPDDYILFQPIYQEYIKDCSTSFQDLYTIGKTSDNILSKDTLNTTIQRSVDFRSVNLTSMKLLNFVASNWLNGTVKMLYDSSKSPEIFEKDYKRNALLLLKIGEEATEIAQCFSTASGWYYQLEALLTDLQTLLLKDVDSDMDEMVKELNKIIKSQDITDKKITDLQQEIAALDNSTATEDNEKRSELISEYRKCVLEELQFKLSKATEELEKAKKQRDNSAFAFFAGPLIGGAIFGGFEIAYEVKKSNYNSLKSDINKAIEAAATGTNIDSALHNVLELTDKVGELGSFCAIMSSWFLGKGTDFETWGQMKMEQADNTLDSWMNWSIDQFLNWMKEDAKAKPYYDKYNESIRECLENEEKANGGEAWTGAKLADADAWTMMDWGLSRNDGKEMLKIIEDSTSNAVADAPWKYYNIEMFVSWMSFVNNNQFAKYKDTVSLSLFEKDANWNGYQLMGITKTEISSWGIKNDNDVNDLYNAIIKLTDASNAPNVPVDYTYWEQQYHQDVEFLDKSLKDCQSMVEALQNLNVDFAINAQGAKTPDANVFKSCRFGAQTFSVQDESKQIL